MIVSLGKRFVTGHPVALHILVAEISVYCSGHFVGPGLGRRVDSASRKTGLTHIKRSYGYGDLVKGVEGNRGTACRKVGAYSEGVVHGRAVHRDIGIAVGASSYEDPGAADICLRGLLEQVIHAPADCRNVHYLLGIQCSECSGTVGTHIRIPAFRRHGHRVEAESRFLQIEVKYGIVSKRDIHVRNFHFHIAETGNRQFVGAACRYVAETVVAFSVRNGMEHGTGGSVHGHHYCTG